MQDKTTKLSAAGKEPQANIYQYRTAARRKLFDEIEPFKTDSLVKEVERVFDSYIPNPFEIDKAKKLLKEHA
ncbi:unnamed protein product [Cochlearia groenlandica]